MSTPPTVSPPATCQHQLEPAIDCIDPAGGKFFNNPYGTVLTTIVELGSTSTLLADSNQSQSPNRAIIEPDAAAVKEFRRIVNGRSSETSSEKAAAYKGPNDDHRAKLGQASTRIRSECSSPKHLFHIFPDYIQLGSVARHEKPHHVQMDCTETRTPSNSAVVIYEACQRLGVSEASEDTVGTRYLPVGHSPRPCSHQRRSATRSSTSSQAPRTSVDEWASAKYNSSAGEQQHKEDTVGQVPYKIEPNGILDDYRNTNKVHVSFSSTRDRSCSTSRPTAHTPPPAYACQHNQRRLSASSSSLENRGSSQMGTPSIHTFRSAALESLLPIAAAQGIIIPYTLTPRHNNQARSSSNRTTRFETSHSELSVLYHRGDVCRHRAAAYMAKGIEPQDTLLEMLEQVRVDGAVEIRERKDWCWRCRVEKRLDGIAGAAVPRSCCFSGADKAGTAERARLVDV
ncbi:hypothetical protein E2P81_ATG08294 [Venturia nashicola]|nr:hypothetical protein E2P81_ATG08294 [Venturia nashicola]